jgi:hypothetical protein
VCNTVSGNWIQFKKLKKHIYSDIVIVIVILFSKVTKSVSQSVLVSGQQIFIFFFFKLSLDSCGFVIKGHPQKEGSPVIPPCTGFV